MAPALRPCRPTPWVPVLSLHAAGTHSAGLYTLACAVPGPGPLVPLVLASSCPPSRHNCNVPFSARRERLGFWQRPVPSCCLPSLGSSSRAGAALQESWEDKDRVLLVPVSRAPDTAAAEGTLAQRSTAFSSSELASPLLAEARGNRSAGPEVRSGGCLRGFGASGLRGT